jgi:hypothetical protein
VKVTFAERRLAGPTVAALLGLVQFGLAGAWAILDPTDLGYIREGSDWGYHYVGWIFYRQSDFTLWPLGAIPDLLHPVGTTVGFTDGIPWLAAALKLASPLLPATFQYIGLWLAICFALNGWFGARLAQAIEPDLPPHTVAAAGALFVVSPLAVLRWPHEALCAHFLILAAIACCFRPSRWRPVVLPAIALGVHPYLAAMAAVPCLAAIIGERRAVLARVAAMLALAVGVAAWLGHLGAGGAPTTGFGKYSADLAAFVTPRDASWIFPRTPGTGEEAYLGLGWLLFGAGAVVVAARRGAPRPHGPLLVATALLAVYAVSPRVTVLGVQLVDLGPLYEPLAFLTGPFRASGRFLWPVAYVLLAGALVVWLRRLPRAAPLAIVAAVTLQLVEAKGLIYVARFQGLPTRTLDPAWQLARGDFDHLVLYPPRCADASYPCCGDFTPRPRHEDLWLAITAAGLGLTINSGGVARAPRDQHQAACAALRDDVTGGRLDPRTIYLVGDGQRAAFRAANPTARCRELDGELACVSPAAAGRFADHLSAASR